MIANSHSVDEGLISGTFNTKHFQELLGFDKLDDDALADVKGNVSAMVQIGSVGGAMLAFVLADRIGRLWATRQLYVASNSLCSIRSQILAVYYGSLVLSFS